MRKFLILAVVALLLVSQFEAKKVKQEKEPKGVKERAKRSVSKVAKAVEDKAHHVHEVTKPDEQLVEEIKPHEELVHEDVSLEEPHRKIVKPKALKVLTAYEQCKAECKKVRDQENAQEYVDRLREELKQAEELIAQQRLQQEQEAQNHESESI